MDYSNLSKNHGHENAESESTVCSLLCLRSVSRFGVNFSDCAHLWWTEELLSDLCAVKQGRPII